MYVLGVDVGTTGTKAVLIDDKGRVLKKAYKGYKLYKPGAALVEQKAEDWWASVVATIRECTNELTDKHNMMAISLSTQGASIVPVDAQGEPLSNAISWMDRRGNTQLKELLDRYDQEFYYKKSGWILEAGGNLVIIKWLKDNKREVFDKTHKFLSTLDYINFKLTGEYVIDPTNAGITQLMDITTGDWDEQLLEVAGIKRNKLAVIVEPGTIIGNLTVEAATQLGLDASVKVINGAHDQYCAALGSGLFQKGDMVLATGTAWIVTGIFDKPVYDKSYIAPGRHVISGIWGALASIPTGGVSMEWYSDNIALKIQKGDQLDTECFKDIDEKIMSTGKKAEGLFFYPYYNGSGYPKWNSSVKASFIGLGLEHDRYDIALAIMEGLAFEANIAFGRFAEMGCTASRLKMLGGAAKSRLWPEIVAAVSGMSVIKMKETDSASIGAAIIAGKGCGMFDNFIDGYEKLGLEEISVEPDSKKRDYYCEKFDRYKRGIELLEAFYK